MKRRAIHIVSEALRAQKMRDICNEEGLSDVVKWE